MPTPTPTPDGDFPTREATAIVYKIEAELIDTSGLGQPNSQWLPGYSTVSARVDRTGTDYEWRVADPSKYRIGDRLTVTVPS